MQNFSRRIGLVLGLMFCLSLGLQAQYGDRDEGRRRDDRRGRDNRGDNDNRHGGAYGRARSLVGRVQEDLRRVERFSRPEGREQDRINNAQRHLSQFDRKLSEGDFDKDKLDEAIEDVKNVVNHNTLPPKGRDELSRDLRDLRQMRSVRGRL